MYKFYHFQIGGIPVCCTFEMMNMILEPFCIFCFWPLSLTITQFIGSQWLWPQLTTCIRSLGTCQHNTHCLRLTIETLFPLFTPLDHSKTSPYLLVLDGVAALLTDPLTCRSAPGTLGLTITTPCLRIHCQYVFTLVLNIQDWKFLLVWSRIQSLSPLPPRDNGLPMYPWLGNPSY